MRSVAPARSTTLTKHVCLAAARPSPLTRPRLEGMGPFCVYGAFFANGFETVVFKEYPAIRLLKERLFGLGAAAACMSGSGSAVFALFRDPAKADSAASVLGPTAAVFSAAL